VDALTRRLRGEGLEAAAYHAALPAATRADVLLQWRAGRLQVVVASVAFGMGVDKGQYCVNVCFCCWWRQKCVQQVSE
jgi:superfamily II DNA helicase RecQ